MRSYEMSSQAFSDTLLSRADISSIMIFGKKKMLLNRSMYTYQKVALDYSKLDWYAKAVAKPQDAIITGPNRHSFFDTDDEVISLSREVQSYENGTFRGVILINLNMNKITEICNSFQEKQENFICIINDKGELVYEQQNGRERFAFDEKENTSGAEYSTWENEGELFQAELQRREISGNQNRYENNRVDSGKYGSVQVCDGRNNGNQWGNDPGCGNYSYSNPASA
ncbi:MAG: cache domain-containing protein [Blautia massiliensis (ex Durand et al. 2017)]|uniref:cache domain-containing protein n=1 Tax=Blautia massiliensis (ex Durand et al. 2017) TaxID=1737424 RepID=UPI00399C54BD